MLFYQKMIYLFANNQDKTKKKKNITMFMTLNYNAGQKLLRQTRKTASYLMPQVMNNQFK